MQSVVRWELAAASCFIWAVLRQYAQRLIYWSWSVVSLAAAFLLALAPPSVGKVAISISM